jgi:hypothetical protein
MLSNTELTATDLHETAERIRSLRTRATEHAVEIGRELARVKASLPHGAFVKWVEKECQFKIRTAQDLMKLAREVDANAQFAALMVPSTLRVLLSKSTPPAARQMVMTRLERGERVSRSDLHAVIAETRTDKAAERVSPQKPAIIRESSIPDLLTAGDARPDMEIDKARRIAELIMRRVSHDDYAFIMDQISWGVWNRVLVWLRAAQPRDNDAAPASAPSARPHTEFAMAPNQRRRACSAVHLAKE